MSEEALSQKAREAFHHIRNWIMHNGRTPSVRELMNVMKYKSSRSALLLMDELVINGFLEKKTEGGLRLIKDLESGASTRTVSIPLVGTVSCGSPLLAEENIEAMIPVSVSLARPGSRYFLLRAKGDSMDKAGINDGDLILVKQQPVADNGQKIVALIDDEATVKEIRHTGEIVMLLPRSTNTNHQPIIVTNDLLIQGVVIATIPKVIN
jgi:repressor LexA